MSGATAAARPSRALDVCILENDSLDPGIAPHVARFGDLYADLLRRAGGQDWRFDICPTTEGGWPERIERYAAVVLTGSRHDAFADTPWIAALRDRVAGLIAAGGVKVVGICFGHQLIGHCLGAPVARAPAGWSLGRVAYSWHGEGRLSAGAGTAFGLLAAHRDQVMALPRGTRLLASAPSCPVAGFTLGDHVLALQPHPELDTAILGNLVEQFRPVLGEDAAAVAHRGLAAGHDGDAIGRLILSFLAA
jgi:GMP synthase-like glutamine amidotransferase